MTPYTPPPDDNTPLIGSRMSPATDQYLRQQLKAITHQVGASIQQNDAILRELGDMRGDMKLLAFRSDGHDKSIEDLDKTRRMAIGALLTSLFAAIGSLLSLIFHSPKG